MKKRILAIASVLALVMVLAVPTTVLADVTDISATNPEAVEVSDLANFNLPNLSLVAPVENPSAKTVTVSANSANWTLTVHDAVGGGKMFSASDNLTSAMRVKGGDQSGYTNLGGSGAKVTLVAGTSALSLATGNAIDDIYFQQPAVVYGDLAGSYSITITFTVTVANP